MENIRKVVDSNALEGVITLPPQWKNRKVEVSVTPVEEVPILLPRGKRPWRACSGCGKVVSSTPES